MASAKQIYNFHTPDRQPLPDTKVFATSATLDKSNIHISSKLTRHSPSPDKYGPVLTIEQQKSQKLAWYNNRIEQLKMYVNSNDKIEKKMVRQIFGWSPDSVSEDYRQLNFLKELSGKVKGLIKQNYELRHNAPSQEQQKLKSENVRLQKLIAELQKDQGSKDLLFEENRHLRDYIDRKKQQSSSNGLKPQKVQISLASQEKSKAGNSNNINSGSPINDLGNLVQRQEQRDDDLNNAKKFMLSYIDAVVQSNEQKLAAQQRYINTLQKRIMTVQKMEKKIDHFSFERAVHLQDSVRKSKNYSVGAATIKGEEHQLQQQVEQQVVANTYIRKQPISRKLFADRAYTSQVIGQQKQTHTLPKNEEISNDYEQLKENYEAELQNRSREYQSEREESQLREQNLQAEKKELTWKVAQLTTELRLSQQKINQLEHILATFDQSAGRASSLCITPKSSVGLTVQLSRIREALEYCDMGYSKSMENSVQNIIIERNALRKQVQQLQTKAIQKSKYSGYQKQIFFLKQKNLQLEQTCKFYERQMADYDSRLKELSQEKEQKLAKDISQEIRLMDSESKLEGMELEGMKWQRMAHDCMINSVNRLMHLENKLKNKMQQSL